MKYLIICFLALFIVQTEGLGQPVPSAFSEGISGEIKDATTGKPLPARVVISDSNGKVYNSFYQKLPGFFTRADGTFEVQLLPGKYKLNVYRGIDYISADSSLTINKNQVINLRINLRAWVPLKEQGWVNGDGHDHLYTEVKHDSLMLDTVRKIFLAQGIDFICAAQGWAGYSDSTWQKGYAPFNDEKLLIHYGSEMPKYRTGHTWWLGQTSTKGIYWNTMDTTYENHYYQSEKGTKWNFDSLKFPQVPDIEIVQRFRNRDNAIAVMAHPTSWWWQKRGDIEKYVTNVPAYLPLGLLAGKIWEGQVVMGYDRDHYYYQNLWFNVLNSGYRMTPVSELDGGYNRSDKFYYGAMRTYYKIDGPLTIDKIKGAAREGKTFVTSGPIVFADIDQKYAIGDVVPANGKPHTISISAYASGDKEDYLSYIVVFRNGKIHKFWDVRSLKIRKVSKKIRIKEAENSWYVIKVYGKRAWKDPAMLDVMRYCEKGINGTPDSIGTESDVAISSPFYFRKPGDPVEPAPLMSLVDIIVKSKDGKEITGRIKAEIIVAGKLIDSVWLANGRGRITMPVHAVVKLSHEGNSPIYRTLYLDYMPVRNVIEHLASGSWLDDYSTRKFNPGEVPWEAFQFEKTHELLRNVSWNILLEPNERDMLWEPIDAVFKSK